MFLTDTVDAADGETLSRSESILDRLAKLILETGPGGDVSPALLNRYSTMLISFHVHIGSVAGFPVGGHSP